MQRILENIHAWRKPDHVHIKKYHRNIREQYDDLVMRHCFSRCLTQASIEHHEQMISDLERENGYSAIMERYVLSLFPSWVEHCWNDEDFSVRIVSSRQIVKAIQEDIEAGLIIANRKIDTTNGMYRPMSKEILVQEGTYPFQPFMSEMFWQHSEDVCGHEFGHYTDDILGFPSENDKRFLSCYARERYRLDAYSAAESREYFATAAWLYCRYKTLMRKFVPKTYRYFENLFRR